jgi:DNA-binding transcriptional ArsR family regulator
LKSGNFVPPIIQSAASPPHPALHGEEQNSVLSLAELLDAFNDSTRRKILLRLSMGERSCSSFGDLGSKTALSYHYAVLRRAGLIDTRQQGTSRIMSLAAARIEAGFPGLLSAVLRATTVESNP